MLHCSTSSRGRCLVGFLRLQSSECTGLCTRTCHKVQNRCCWRSDEDKPYFPMSNLASPSNLPRTKKAKTKEVPSRYLTHLPRKETEVKKANSKQSTPSKVTPKPLKNSSSNTSLDGSTSLKTTPRVKTLKQELKELEGMQSLLIEWVYANALVNQTIAQQKENAEQEIYDRGLQLMDLKQKLMDVEYNCKATEQTKLLDTVLHLEYATLQKSEDDLLTSSSYLGDVERTLSQASNRLALGEGVIIDPSLLQEGIGAAAGVLDQIKEMLSEDSAELEMLATDITDLSTIMRDECSEIHNFQSLLEKVLKLSSLERSSIVEKAQQTREQVLSELLFDDNTI
mmetsp:Transcript_34002/g.59261  ORF Transcript_34002/g.59261 Transcript_34002/m.59261 type:complete len:340 (+) Transcript_34002:2122-3141(+)